MRIIVGVSGATGVVLAYYMAAALKQHDDVELHLVVTAGARHTWDLECPGVPFEKLTDLADVVHNDANLGASISSGSYHTDGMIVVPCSMKTLAGVAAGYATNLVVRAVDVCLKEERRVVLVPREMPLSKIHIRNLKEAADAGCSIVPPMLTFYNAPETLEHQINHVVGKVLRLFGLDHKQFVAWEGEEL